MAKAIKLPSGNWRVQAHSHGQTKSFTATTKRGAEMAALEWQSQRKEDFSADKTLAAAAEEYIAQRKNIISPVTLQTYKGYIRRYLKDLQCIPISEITQKSLQMSYNELAGKLSAKTLKSVYGFYNSVFKANGIEFSITLPKIYKKSYNTPNKEMGAKILECAKGSNVELPVNLALKCGLRISEISGLKWSAVHDNYIIIDNVLVAFGAGTYEKKPKSSAGNRKIPITPEIKALIDKQPKTSEYVVPLNPNAIRARFNKLLQKNDLPHIKFHELRHAFASNMALLGIPEAYAKSIGGWDTGAVLHGIYEQIFFEQEKEFIEKVQNFYK